MVSFLEIYFSRTSFQYIDEEFKKNKSLSKDREKNVRDRERHAEDIPKEKAPNVAYYTHSLSLSHLIEQTKNKLFAKYFLNNTEKEKPLDVYMNHSFVRSTSFSSTEFHYI